MSWKTDPCRRSIPFRDWPDVDRSAWENATAECDILEGQSRASGWAEATKKTNKHHYGRWLGYIAYADGPFTVDHPAKRVTPDLVKAYSLHLETLVAPMTRLSMLVGLKEVIRAMCLDEDWRWLQDYCNAVQRLAKPSKDKRRLVRPSAEIYNAAVIELARLKGYEDKLACRLMFRNTLMLALCAARPLRVRNLGGIVIDKNIVKSGEQWLLVFEADEVKTKEPLEYFVPDALITFLEYYLEKVRPKFPQVHQTSDLWLSKVGICRDKRFPYWWITKSTKRLLGQAINPHLIRDCVATDLAEHSPEAVSAAATMLGHRHLSTTEKYYIHASNVRASRKVNSILEDIINAPEVTL